MRHARLVSRNLNFKKTTIATLIWSVCTSAATTSQAQSDAKIEVTGSSIRRVQTESSSLLQIITSEEIERSGKTSVAEYLQTITADNQGSIPMTFGSGFAAGASGISLRGLGAQSTLVLINGRRIAPYGLADDGQKVFADLNVIPLEAVDRVEILKDGASAIYGSDAIAGVVNVILRRNFSGTVAKASVGQSRYGDGTEKVASITHGSGNEKGGTNLLFSIEMRNKEAIWNRDRTDRGFVGSSDYRAIGGDTHQLGGYVLRGTGASSSLLGNVRKPGTVADYFSRSDTTAGNGFTAPQTGANCANFSRGTPQGDPDGGCLINSARAFQQVQPSQKSVNIFTRVSREINPALELYGEFGFYKSDSTSSSSPSAVHSSTGYPGGPVPNTAVALGASHPDNPFFGTAARLRYLAGDVGPRVSNIESSFTRAVTGAKGTLGSWDFDTALLHSETNVSNVRNGYLQRDVTNALLNPLGILTVPGKTNDAVARATSPSYASLPSGTYWRIGENAYLNTSTLYSALSPTINNDAKASTTSFDFKLSREVGRLEGGPIGVAMGFDVRRESVALDPTKGTDRGNIIGLGYSAYSGSRTVVAAFGEALFPLTKQLEANTALRIDHYGGNLGTSVTPKAGLKWMPVNNFAVRGTYSQGFRAPSPAENGTGGLAAFASVVDPIRCNLGVANACNPISVAVITSPNSRLKPEESESVTMGAVWDVTPKTSIAADFWQIKRKNEINQQTTESAINAGNVSRDPTNLSTIPGDPGTITAVLANYINSSSTVVQGLDADIRHRIDLNGGNGKVTLNATWTHLLGFKRTETDGTTVEYAGSHGNCDVTNCIGTPKDRFLLGATWDSAKWRLAAVANIRGRLKDTYGKTTSPDGTVDESCIDHSPMQSGCKVKSFYTVDVSALWRLDSKTEVFGVIRNLFDKVPPIDFTTYGATSYNPLDFSGAVGRYFSLGLRHRF